MKLKELQKTFINAVITDNDEKIETELNTSRHSAKYLMDVYRNNTNSTLIHALSLTYPVAIKLVGEKFFRGCCREYIKKHLPKSSNLDEYGGDFSAFLSEFSPAGKIIYLSDMAKLEWLYHESSLAERSGTLDQRVMAKIPKEKYHDLRFKLHPSVRLFSSSFPVHLIWEMAHDEKNNKTLDLSAEGGAEILIVRPYIETSLITISKAERAFIEALGNNLTLFEAFGAATTHDEEFDLAFYLSKHIVHGTFSSFSLN